MTVVAEGVEDDATWRALADRGCDLVQGDAMTRPLPVAALEEWIERWSARGPPRSPARVPTPRTTADAGAARTAARSGRRLATEVGTEECLPC